MLGYVVDASSKGLTVSTETMLADVAAQGGAVLVAATVDGVSRLLYQPPGTHGFQVLDTPVRKVGRYGGGFATPSGPGELAYVARDGSIAMSPGGTSLWGDGSPVACLVGSPVDDRLAFVVDDGESATCWIVDRAGELTGPIADDHDFVCDPVWSPDGRYLAVQVWDDPDMAFVHSKILLVDVAAERSTPKPVHVIDQGCSLSQPRFLPLGDRLGFLSDASSMTLPWTFELKTGCVAPWILDVGDWGEPTQGFNQSDWMPISEAQAVGCRNEAGFAALVLGTVGSERAVTLRHGVHTSIRYDDGVVWALRQGARTPPELRRYDLSDRLAPSLADNPTESAVDAAGPKQPRRPPSEVLVTTAAEDPELEVEPQVVQWVASDGLELDGLLYLPPDGASVLVTKVHGGPVGQSRVCWDSRTRTYLDRGWAVFAPNIRGSSGSGRMRMSAIKGAWGRDDLDDVVAGISAVRSVVGPVGGIFVEGSSSGGLVSLLLASHMLDLDGVIAHFPVTDIAATDEGTHRVERHYSKWLVGDTAQELMRRSPLAHTATIAVPMIVTQGTADVVVPVDLTRRYVAEARNAGADVTYVELPDEGHGYSPKGAALALSAVGDFVGRCLAARSRA